MTFMELEPHTFCYPGRCPKPVRLEEISNARLASECIITDIENIPNQSIFLLLKIIFWEIESADLF
jgi:hypothetical protein